MGLERSMGIEGKSVRNGKSVGVRWKGKGKREERKTGETIKRQAMWQHQGTQRGALSRRDCRTMLKNNTIAPHFAPSMKLCR